MKLHSQSVWPALVQAKDFYLEFLERLRSEYVAERVKDGVFGAMMDVSLVNDVSLATVPVARVLYSVSSLPNDILAEVVKAGQQFVQMPACLERE